LVIEIDPVFLLTSFHSCLFL